MVLSARSITFIQDTINPYTRRGNAMYLDDLIGTMADYGWKGDPIDVVEKDGILYTLDHRRLAAAKVIGIGVPVNILDLSVVSVAREFRRKSSGLRAGTRGLYIDILGTDIRIDMNGNITFID
jgi:hypothetical protein